MRFGRLRRDLATPLGIHPAGCSVVVLSVSSKKARLCLDFGIHLTEKCHTATVPPGLVEGAQSRRELIMKSARAAA